jgi:hypothetical protein
MDARVAVIHRQHDRGDAYVGEGRIVHVVAKQRVELFENQTLNTLVAMARAFILSSHGKTAPSGDLAAQRKSRSAPSRRVIPAVLRRREKR